MNYILEFYQDGDPIETRDDYRLSFVPVVGELIYFEAKNKNIVDECGCYWRVVERRLLLLSGDVQTVQLACEPVEDWAPIGCSEEVI